MAANSFHVCNLHVHECEPAVSTFAHIFWEFFEKPIHGLEASPIIWPQFVPWDARIRVGDHMPAFAYVYFQKATKQTATLR